MNNVKANTYFIKDGNVYHTLMVDKNGVYCVKTYLKKDKFHDLDYIFLFFHKELANIKVL